MAQVFSKPLVIPVKTDCIQVQLSTDVKMVIKMINLSVKFKHTYLPPCHDFEV